MTNIEKFLAKVDWPYVAQEMHGNGYALVPGLLTALQRRALIRQLVLFLNEPEEDYTGGEFVLVQQNPRAQSKAMVLRPRRGDMLLFTTNFRPVKSARGYYRAAMRHGVSEVHSGQRHTVGIIFHEALT